jgi:hypothetical protein
MAFYMDHTKTTHYSLSPTANLIAVLMLAEAQFVVVLLIFWMNAFLTDWANNGDGKKETI